MYLLHNGHTPVTLIDLDLVEPFYTLRPIKVQLEAEGLEVIAWETADTLGLGEAGNILKPDMRWALKKEGSIIFDVGYGIDGAKKTRLLEGAEELKIYVVVNIARPMTGDVMRIVEYVQSLGRVDGLINNSHLGDDTDLEIIEEGVEVVTEAAKKLGLPVIWTAVEEKFAEQIGDYDKKGNPVFFLKRRMQHTFW